MLWSLGLLPLFRLIIGERTRAFLLLVGLLADCTLCGIMPPPPLCLLSR